MRRFTATVVRAIALAVAAARALPHSFFVAFWRCPPIAGASRRDIAVKVRSAKASKRLRTLPEPRAPRQVGCAASIHRPCRNLVVRVLEPVLAMGARRFATRRESLISLISPFRRTGARIFATQTRFRQARFGRDRAASEGRSRGVLQEIWKDPASPHRAFVVLPHPCRSRPSMERRWEGTTRGDERPVLLACVIDGQL